MSLCLQRISSLKPYVKPNLNLSEHLILTQNQAYQRMKSRKSLLASGILDSIKKFFESAEFAGRPDKIREYVLWALRPGGPAYYGIRYTNTTGMQGEIRQSRLHCVSHSSPLTWLMMKIYYSILGLSWNLSSSSRLPKSTWPMLHSPSSLLCSTESIRRRVYMLWFWSRYVHLRSL